MVGEVIEQEALPRADARPLGGEAGLQVAVGRVLIEGLRPHVFDELMALVLSGQAGSRRPAERSLQLVEQTIQRARYVQLTGSAAAQRSLNVLVLESSCEQRDCRIHIGPGRAELEEDPGIGETVGR